MTVSFMRVATYIIGILVSLCGNVYATDRSILQAENELGIGTGLTHLGYGETLPGFPGYFDVENGELNTTVLNWSGLLDEDDNRLVFLGMHVPPGTYLAGNLQYLTGAPAYDGHFQDGTPASGTNLSTFFRLNLAAGFSKTLTRNLVLIPMFDFGYHYWKRTIQPNFIINGVNFENNETYSHYNVGLGAQLDWKMMEGEVFAVGLDILENVNSTMYSDMTGDTYTLGNSITYRLKGKLTFEPIKNVNLFGSVIAESFSYGASPIQADQTLEPDSKTTLVFYTVGVAYAY